MIKAKAYLLATEIDRRLQMNLSNGRFEILAKICNFYEEEFLRGKTRQEMFELLNRWEN